MKKVLLLQLFFISISFFANATIHIVEVANFQFNPKNVPDVIVGDTMRWVWVSGAHTTTDDPATHSGNKLPEGAATWDAAISAENRTFDYKVTVSGDYNYWCTPHSPNMSASFTASKALPITLASFAVVMENRSAVVRWKTLTEQNANYFSVRRSLNGSTFTEIAKIPATGNSTVENSYSFTDPDVDKGVYYYYNIATIDRDGRQQFSETKILKGAGAIRKLVLSISPNPLSSPGHLMVTFNASKEGKMQVNIINTQGQTVIKTQMQAFQGVNTGHVHLGNLAAGNYTVQCILSGVKETHQIVFK